LPALPGHWSTGHVTGLRARGGFEVELAWDSGKLTEVKIQSVGGRKAMVRYGNRTAEINLSPGKTVRLSAELKRGGK